MYNVTDVAAKPALVKWLQYAHNMHRISFTESQKWDQSAIPIMIIPTMNFEIAMLRFVAQDKRYETVSR